MEKKKNDKENVCGCDEERVREISRDELKKAIKEAEESRPKETKESEKGKEK